MIGPDVGNAEGQEDKNGEKGKTFLWVFRTKSDLLDSTKHLPRPRNVGRGRRR